MNNTVEIVGLTRRYGSRRGIENVSLLINEGEIVGLLGPNGCGKTTLIKLVMGLLQPDEGSVSILGLKRRRRIILSHTCPSRRTSATG